MQELEAGFLRHVVDGAPEGIVVCDARHSDQPVIYVNSAFERMTGYAAGELVGANLRLLQGTDREQEARKRMREAIGRGESCRVLIRNYRKDGAMLWNEVLIQPLRDGSGALTHFIGYHRDAGERLKSPERPLEGLPTWLREDRVTGLSSRPWFEELMLRDWAAARRDARPLTLILFDIDGLGSYNETFGRSAGDACIRRVARTIASCFRRGADVVGRWENGCIAVLAVQSEPESVCKYAGTVVKRVAELKIHHPRSVSQKHVTVSAGAASLLPQRDEVDCSRLVRGALAAMQRAKEAGRDRLLVAEPAEFGDHA
ncbi:MAG: diguanylate cyclase [Pseudomonadota bacterium]